MVEIGSVITVISVCVAIGSLAISAFMANHNKTKDVKEETKDNVEIHASLQSQIDILSNTISPRIETIDDGIRDLKAENRTVRSEITQMRDDMHKEIRDLRDDMHNQISEVNEKAIHATELAEAAHRRLDRAGIPEE